MDQDKKLQPLRQARLRRGWSQSQAITRFLAAAARIRVAVPAPSSMRALFSMYENGRREVPNAYRAVFRELYRASDDELGFTGRAGGGATDPSPLELPAMRAGAPPEPTPELLGFLAEVCELLGRTPSPARGT